MAGRLRLIGSLLAAVVLVGALTLALVGAWFERPPVHQVEAFRVEPASAAELALVRGEDGAPPAALPADLERDGFVQLQFLVTAQGRARDIEVVAAVPAGVYEDEAIARVRDGRYIPSVEGGAVVERVQTRIVDFKYRR